jgi:Mg-chelatase subunit ChlD
MKTGYSHIVMVVDRSGSMNAIQMDAIGGFNAFLADQKKVPGGATLSLIGFDDRYEIWQEWKPIQDVPELTTQTFVPRGSTALLDAIGRTINETGKKLESMAEMDRPERVICVILTDGYENASKQFNMQQIAEMIANQTDTYKWTFIFLAANLDAIATASSINIPARASMAYYGNAGGIRAAYGSVSAQVRLSRRGHAVKFTQQDRDKAQNS